MATRERVDFENEYQKLRRLLPVKNNVSTIFFDRSRFVDRCIKYFELTKGKRILVVGYSNDVNIMCSEFKKRGITATPHILFAEHFEGDGALSIYGNDSLKQAAEVAKKSDILFVCTREIRFLIAMVCYSFCKNCKIIDIYDWYEYFFHKKMLIDIDMKLNYADGKYSLMRRRSQVVMPIANRSRIVRRIKHLSKIVVNNDTCFAHLHEYESAQSESEKRFFLEKIIQDLYDVKDIKSLKYYLGIFGSEYADKQKACIHLSDAIDRLLYRMKSEIEKKEGILVFWTDSVCQKEADDWNFLEELKRDSLVLSNTYTTIPYTDTVMHSMITGNSYTEDEADYIDGYIVGNSFKNHDMKLFPELIGGGYKAIEVGARYIDLHRPGAEPTAYPWSVEIVYKYRPTTISLFEAACAVAACDEKTFIIIHADNETHHPYWSPFGSALEIGKYGLLDDPDECIIQRKEAMKYLEDQIVWWTRLFPDKSFKKVYLGDHGTVGIPYSNQRIRPYCFVTGLGVKKGKDERIFSYFNFYKLIRYLVTLKDKDYEDMFSKYALVENQDPYSEGFIAQIKKDLHFGTTDFMKCYYRWAPFRGYVDKDYKVIRFRNGETKIFNSIDEQEISRDEIDGDKLEEIIEIIGDRFEDLSMNKLKETKCFYAECTALGYNVC